MKILTKLLALCALCALLAATPTYATFSPTPSVVTTPYDSYADSHGQISGFLSNGEFLSDPDVASLLAGWGWSAPWTSADGAYALTHADAGTRRSLLSQLQALLFAKKLIGATPPDIPDSQDYPGKPSFSDTLRRLEEYGLTTATSGSAEKRFFIQKYWENRLTPAADALWMAKERGLYVLPEAFEVDISARQLYVALERAVAAWGLSGQEADRVSAYVAYWSFERAVLPSPGEANAASAPSAGSLVINPRRVFYRARKIENAIALGNPSTAAKLGTGCAWLLGIPSLYEQYALQTYPLSPNDWRAALGQPLVFGGGGGFYIGGQGSN